MIRYVVGFAFDSEKKNVLLVLKNRPAWQAGLFNGIGGKIEQGESPIQAMVREFHEETGILTTEEAWSKFSQDVYDDHAIYKFVSTLDLETMKKAEEFVSDEPITCLEAEHFHTLYFRGVPNLVVLLEEASKAL